jgi:uncharacterized membrane protein
MHGKCKALGLALLAALALTAVTAPAASAQFTSTSHHTILSGAQKTGTNDVFSLGAGFGTITCENLTVSGTSASTSQTSTTITIFPSSCKDSFGRIVHVSADSVTQTQNGTLHVHGAKKIEVTSGGKAICTATIGVQEGVNGMSYKNLGGTSGMEVTIHATNLKSTIEGGFFNCGTSTTNATAGTYDGVWVVTGKDTAGNAVAINKD